MRPFRIIQDRWSFKIHAGLIPGGKVSWLEMLLCGQVQVPPLTSSAGELVASRRFTSHKLLLRTGDDAVAGAETAFILGERG